MLYNLKQLYARVSYVKPNKIIIIMMEAPKAWMNAKCKNRPFVNYYGRVIFNVEENAVKDLTHSLSLHFKSVCRWIDKTHELYLKKTHLLRFEIQYFRYLISGSFRYRNLVWNLMLRNTVFTFLCNFTLFQRTYSWPKLVMICDIVYSFRKDKCCPKEMKQNK